MSNCKICQKTSLPSLQFSCGDKICSNCIHKVLIYNLNSFFPMEGINQEISLKCIICNFGFYITKKIEIYEFLQIIQKEEEVVSKTCEKHKLDLIIDCLKCDEKLCISCFATHPKNHLLSQDKNAKKRICGTCKNEILQYQCITCTSPCCTLCEKIVHKNHTIIPINEYAEKKLGEINSIQLPKKDINEFRNNLKLNEMESVEKLKNISVELIQKINGLITKMKDLIEIIKNTYEEKAREIKISNFIIENVFSKIYSDIASIPKDDYINMHLISKFPKIFQDFMMKTYVVGNYEQSLNIILKELDAIKNENINFDKLGIEFEYNYDYKLVKTLEKTNRIVLSLHQLSNGHIMSATDEIIYISDANKNFTRITDFGKNESYLYNYRYNSSIFTCFLTMPDNKIIVGGNSKERLLVYDANNNYKLVKNYEIYLGNPCCLEFISKKNHVVCGSLNGNISVIDSQNWIYLNTLSANSPIRCLLYIPDRDILLSGSDDKLIKVWNTNKDYILIKSLTGHNNPVYSLCSLRNGLFASGCLTEIKIWDEEFICQKTIQAHTSRITNLKLLDNGDLVSSSIDKTFKVWSKFSFYCKSIVDVGSPIYSILTLNNKNILTGTENSEIKVWS